ncbi:MAG: hypothetical protein HY075_13770 [Deltaproteobacteria bacterium]|nr:hypothetical protein [Deltaproteobacteria bacterium]
MRGHGRKPAAEGSTDKGMGSFSKKASDRLALKTGRNPPHTKNIVTPSRRSRKIA